MTKKNIKEIVKEYFILTIGVLIFVFAWGSLMIPNEMVSGGLTGICTIVQIATHGVVPVHISYAVTNALLLLLAFFVLGTGFGFKTIYCIVLSTVLFDVWANIPEMHAVQGRFMYISSPVLIPLFAGILEAIGITIIFSHGGSTGGSDILALIANKYWPVSPSKVFMYLDVFVIASLLLIPGKTFTDVLYGYEMMLVFTITLDYLFTAGTQASAQILVFSEKYSEIADRIINELDRGVTVLKAQGWFTKSDKNVLLILVKQRQVYELTKFINEADPKAFVSVVKASSVYGEGFEEIKVGLKTSKNDKTKNLKG